MLISILPGPTMITVVDEYFLDGSKTPSTFNGLTIQVWLLVEARGTLESGLILKIFERPP
jgi:hypothetical protein